MDLEAAIELLNTCTRDELRDHSFGDREISWMRAGWEVASGYFGSSRSVFIPDGGKNAQGLQTGTSFTGAEAERLSQCGTKASYTRNDSTGPDAYQDGQCLPELTLEGVRKELEAN